MRNVAAVAIGLLMGLCLANRATAQTSISPLGNCAGIADFRGFSIRQARLEDPFWILRSRKPSGATLAAIEDLKGKPYAFSTVNAVSTQIEGETWLPDTPDAWLRIDFSDIGIVDCREGQLDVVFTIVSATVSPTLSTLFEWGSKQKTPNETAGLARTDAAWEFAPAMGFDRARGIAAGGRAQTTWAGGHVPFRSLEVKGAGATESHALSVSLIGGHEAVTGWLRRASWRVVFDDSSTPTGSVHLDRRAFGLQFSGTSRAVKGVVTRFGGVLDGGRLRSGFTASQLPAQTVSDSDFTSAKVFGGVTGRGRQQSFAAAYALVLGSTGGGFHGDWRKHIGDIAHDVWIPFGNHRLFELEQRLTLGRIQTIDRVPATERFFGGAAEETLPLGDEWRLRTTPVVRSIPTNRFSPTDAGVGGDRFVAYNSTTAFTVWRKPLMPPELLNDQEFNRTLQAQLVSGRSTLDVVYRSGDVNFQTIKTRLPDLVAKLARVETVEAAARSAGGLPAVDFRPCEEALHASRSAADHARADKPFPAYGWVSELLPGGNNALADVVTACGEDLVGKLKAAGAAAGELEAAANDLKPLSAGIETSFAAIDTNKSARRAGDAMASAERALGLITKQMNITSISPVFVVDVAHVGPSGSDPYGGNRYAIGGGIRFTLVSTVNLTATYAVNPHRRPGEGSGALVFSLTTRNLFE